jgi:hypothetical protein
MRCSVGIRWFGVTIALAAGTACSAEQFDSVNKSIIETRKVTAAVGSTAAPAAALAATLGALEVAKTLTNELITKSDGGSFLAQGGANLDAPRFTLKQTETNTTETKVKRNGVDIQLRYKSEFDRSSGRVTGTLEQYEGVTQGYKISAQGSVTFKPAVLRLNVNDELEGQPGDFGIQLSGRLSFKDLDLNLKKLALEATFPLLADQELGSFDFAGKDGPNSAAVNATVRTNDKGRLTANGTLTFKDKTQAISFDQDRPGFTEVTQQAASQ